MHLIAASAISSPSSSGRERTPARRDLLEKLLALVTNFGLAFDPQLAGLFRALVTLEGTLRVLDPNFVIDEAKTMAADIGSKTFGAAALAGSVRDELTSLLPLLRRVPRRLDRISRSLGAQRVGINVRLLADERDTRVVMRIGDRAVAGLLSAAIGVVSALLLNVRAAFW